MGPCKRTLSQTSSVFMNALIWSMKEDLTATVIRAFTLSDNKHTETVLVFVEPFEATYCCALNHEKINYGKDNVLHQN